MQHSFMGGSSPLVSLGWCHKWHTVMDWCCSPQTPTLMSSTQQLEMLLRCPGATAICCSIQAAFQLVWALMFPPEHTRLHGLSTVPVITVLLQWGWRSSLLMVKRATGGKRCWIHHTLLCVRKLPYTARVPCSIHR